jgi:hypothetical protein
VATYYDKREQREKPIPDCSRIGCIWDEETQRCERRNIFELMAYYSEQPAEYFYQEYNEPDGLGFLPAVAAAPAIGPAIWAGIASIGGAIASFFGFGGDDQKTDYRAPANAAQQFVSFNDKYGSEQVAYDMGPQTQQITAANGNRWDDVNSYYSAFVSNSTSAGASSAARRVIEDVARQHGVSISRAADLVLQAAGAVRIVNSLLPSGQGQPTANNQGAYQLPGYCPVGTYHPLDDPFACVPFPGWGDNSSQASSQTRTAQQTAQQAARTAAQLATQNRTGSALPGSQQTGQRTNTGQGQSLSDLFSKAPWPLWILLALLAALALSGDSDRGTTTTITRRKK